LEEEKAKEELRKVHQDEIYYLENEKENEYNLLTESSERILRETMSKFEDLQQNLKEQHKQELQESMKFLEDNFPEVNPKSSAEILNLQKILEGLVKRKQ
jgi:hypothetical protein